ncbi:MAG: Crp/Fnr family transcriptional regulator [Candidatus Bipolaricaulota bacterium]|nr:Crp/Fnr family transcriptional regulator [Candidatus Bipolaricaulota bacterium]MBS3791021.1 Crp/Fnr family transcriptional regulator [Candidatus Bipolaricaulota bacterium]
MTPGRQYSSLGKLFDDLAENEGATVNYDHGETIYKEGEPDNKVYRIKSGGVSQSQRIPNGNLLTYQILLPDDIFSTYHLSSSVVNQPCTAKSLVDSTLQEVLRDSFKEQLLNNPELALQVMDMISDELQSRDRTLENQISMTAKERIYSILNKVAPLGEKKGDRRIIRFLTRKELAEMAGMTEETVTRSLGELEKEGLLKKNRGEVVLLP